MHALPRPTATGEERFFGDEEIIVSKTDPKGIITYVNDVFCRISGYRRDELLGQPHNVIRHPETPRGIFRYLWQTISSGREVFAFIDNLARDGAHYWVLAHVTPTHDAGGRIVGYHSNRRLPDRDSIRRIEPVYARMREVERPYGRPTEAGEASWTALTAELAEQGLTYDEFVWQLIPRSEVSA